MARARAVCCERGLSPSSDGGDGGSPPWPMTSDVWMEWDSGQRAQPGASPRALPSCPHSG
jgi:hypothetical protein